MAEDVEIVRAALRAYVDHDVAGVLQALDPDVELYPIRAVLEGTPYRGHDGFRRFVEDMSEDWQQFTIEPEEVRVMEPGRVLVSGRFRGKLASGVEVDNPAVWVCELRDGKIVRLRFYADEAAAVEALTRR